MWLHLVNKIRCVCTVHVHVMCARVYVVYVCVHTCTCISYIFHDVCARTVHMTSFKIRNTILNASD